MQRAFSLHNFSNPETEEPEGMTCDFTAGKKQEQFHFIVFVLLGRLPLVQVWGHKELEELSPDFDSMPLLTAAPHIWLLQTRGRPPAPHQPAHAISGSPPILLCLVHNCTVQARASPRRYQPLLPLPADACEQSAQHALHYSLVLSLLSAHAARALSELLPSKQLLLIT